MRRRSGPQDAQTGDEDYGADERRGRKGGSRTICAVFCALMIGCMLLGAALLGAEDGGGALPARVVQMGQLSSFAAGAQDPDFGGKPEDLWVPTDVEFGGSGSVPMVTMCRISGATLLERSKHPSLTPMFRDLVGRHCGVENSKTVDLKVAVAEAEAAGTARDPDGFIFHESRVGSTLVANMLASVTRFLVFSESKPPATVLLHAPSLPRARQVGVLRDVMRLMCASSFHTRCFFKFQSATVPKMDVALDAFPRVPWMFLFRDPEQTMMSHMGNLPAGKATGNMPPCLRSRRSPPRAVAAKLGPGARDASPEDYCAAHLAVLCDAAADNFRRSETGALVEYTTLPGAVPDVILPGLFRTYVPPAVEARMLQEAQHYSKDRGGGKRALGKTAGGLWRDDSDRKERAAGGAVRAATERYLHPRYKAMAEQAEHTYAMLDAKARALTAEEEAKRRGGAEESAGGGAAPRLPGLEWTAPRAWAGGSVPLDFRGKAKAEWASHARGVVSATGHSLYVEPPDCPPVPAPGYPRHYGAMEVLSNWPPDDTRVPERHYGSLCRFDYETERDTAFAYRDAEVPFIVYNVPSVDETVEKWADVQYLQGRLKRRQYRTEQSKNNHFMFWNGKKKGRSAFDKAFEEPTKIIKMTFDEWISHALRAESPEKPLDSTHYYFRVGDKEEPWIRKEDVTIFSGAKNLFMKEPQFQRGIHCRFGMRSVIAESHYDASRNFVAQLGGARRWIMSMPSECSNMYLLPMNHPSGRHSEVDWSDPDLDKYPKFRDLKAFDVVMHPGEVLYVPAYWFHYIVSLGINWQCNSRSGKSPLGAADIEACGFVA